MSDRAHVVWDWNGTLVDDRTVVVEATAATATEITGRTVTAAQVRDAVSTSMRDTLGTLVGRAMNDASWRAARDRILTFYARTPPPPLVPSARRTLIAVMAAGHHQSVLSNWPQDALRQAIRDQDLNGWFTAASGAADQHTLDKAVRLATLRSSLRRGTPLLVVGDTLGDAHAAASVGAAAVICTTYSLVQAAADDIRATGAQPVRDIAEVAAIAAALPEEGRGVDRRVSA
ncbi:MAG: hypothetical protein QOE97_2901 [Pseudonocardiales bacterium]|nr:hypothetical protein [Pseudonocardiales bacterium]